MKRLLTVVFLLVLIGLGAIVAYQNSPWIQEKVEGLQNLNWNSTNPPSATNNPRPTNVPVATSTPIVASTESDALDRANPSATPRARNTVVPTVRPTNTPAPTLVPPTRTPAPTLAPPTPTTESGSSIRRIGVRAQAEETEEILEVEAQSLDEPFVPTPFPTLSPNQTPTATPVLRG